MFDLPLYIRIVGLFILQDLIERFIVYHFDTPDDRSKVVVAMGGANIIALFLAYIAVKWKWLERTFNQERLCDARIACEATASSISAMIVIQLYKQYISDDTASVINGEAYMVLIALGIYIIVEWLRASINDPAFIAWISECRCCCKRVYAPVR